MGKQRVRRWSEIVEAAAPLVDGQTSLRRLFYLLVSEGLLPNAESYYKQLSAHTAEARRAGTFPDLIDMGRDIHEPQTWTSPADAKAWLLDRYMLDRTAGQDWQIWIAGEKDTMQPLLWRWFSAFGVPILILRGNASQTYVDEVAERVAADDRPAALIYAGDHDPSGVAIPEDFVARVERSSGSRLIVERVAILPEHAEQFDLIEYPGKLTDTRAAGFEARFGSLIQVEIEALDTDVLRRLYMEAFGRYWNMEAYEEVLEQEEMDKAILDKVIG